MDWSVATLGVVLVAFLLAGFVKGVIGLGLPTVAMGLLAIAVAPAQAAALLVVPSFVTNVWQLAAGPSLVPLWRRLWTLLLGILVGALLGALLGAFVGGGLLVTDDGTRASIGLGIALVLYAVAGLTSFTVPVQARWEPWLSPLIGAATGVVTAATGVFVLPAVPYLQAMGLDKDDLVQALGLSFLVSTLALAGLLAHDGAMQWSIAGGSLVALAPALLGMAIGQRVRALVRPATFRTCFFLGLLLLGAHLASRVLI
jgi:uncharacterized membrane protein YfcA